MPGNKKFDIVLTMENGAKQVIHREDFLFLLWSIYCIQDGGQEDEASFSAMMLEPKTEPSKGLHRPIQPNPYFIELLLRGGSIYSMKVDPPEDFYADGKNKTCLKYRAVERELDWLLLFANGVTRIFGQKRTARYSKGVLRPLLQILSNSHDNDGMILVEVKERV